MTSLARYLKYNAKGLGGDTDGKELIGAARNLSDTFKILLTRMDPQKQMVRVCLALLLVASQPKAMRLL